MGGLVWLSEVRVSSKVGGRIYPCVGGLKVGYLLIMTRNKRSVVKQDTSQGSNQPNPKEREM